MLEKAMDDEPDYDLLFAEFTKEKREVLIALAIVDALDTLRHPRDNDAAVEAERANNA